MMLCADVLFTCYHQENERFVCVCVYVCVWVCACVCVYDKQDKWGDVVCIQQGS
jgi:hypothetical protein